MKSRLTNARGTTCLFFKNHNYQQLDSELGELSEIKKMTLCIEWLEQAKIQRNMPKKYVMLEILSAGSLLITAILLGYAKKKTKDYKLEKAAWANEGEVYYNNLTQTIIEPYREKIFQAWNEGEKAIRDYETVPISNDTDITCFSVYNIEIYNCNQSNIVLEICKEFQNRLCTAGDAYEALSIILNNMYELFDNLMADFSSHSPKKPGWINTTQDSSIIFMCAAAFILGVTFYFHHNFVKSSNNIQLKNFFSAEKLNFIKQTCESLKLEASDESSIWHICSELKIKRNELNKFLATEHQKIKRRRTFLFGAHLNNASTDLHQFFKRDGDKAATKLILEYAELLPRHLMRQDNKMVKM